MEAEYGRQPKDYTLRFDIIERTDTAVPGHVYIAVQQVGSAYSCYRAVIDADGNVSTVDFDRVPDEAQSAVIEARARVYRISRKRKGGLPGANVEVYSDGK